MSCTYLKEMPCTKLQGISGSWVMSSAFSRQGFLRSALRSVLSVGLTLSQLAPGSKAFAAARGLGASCCSPCPCCSAQNVLHRGHPCTRFLPIKLFFFPFPSCDSWEAKGLRTQGEREGFSSALCKWEPLTGGLNCL